MEDARRDLPQGAVERDRRADAHQAGLGGECAYIVLLKRVHLSFTCFPRLNTSFHDLFLLTLTVMFQGKEVARLSGTKILDGLDEIIRD